MEILKSVAGNVRKRSSRFYLWLITSFIVFIGILYGSIFSGKITPKYGYNEQMQRSELNNLYNFFFFKQIKKIDIRIWCFLEVLALLGIIYIWFYYAPIFYKKLRNLYNAFKDNKEYQNLYNHFKQWTKQFDYDISKKSPTKKSFWVKLIYNIVWLIYGITITFYTYSCFSDLSLSSITVVMFEMLIISVILLNFSSYYNCVVFVYFVMRVLKLAQKDNLDYVKELPSTTYGFQELKSTADTIYIYFLLDSALCTIAFVCFLGIVPLDMNSYFYVHSGAGIFEAVFLIINGLISWIGIALLLRTYLYRLHDHWKSKSLKLYQEEYNKVKHDLAKNKTNSGKKLKGKKSIEEITNLMNQLSQDKMAMNKWEFGTSLATLIADLATAGITFDIIFKMFFSK